MPNAIKHFSQAVALCPDNWTTSEQILQHFDHEGHRNTFLNTLVAFIMALHDILYLWKKRVLDGTIGSLHTPSIERLYPLSPFQTAIFRDIMNSLGQRQSFLNHGSPNIASFMANLEQESPKS